MTTIERVVAVKTPYNVVTGVAVEEVVGNTAMESIITVKTMHCHGLVVKAPYIIIVSSTVHDMRALANFFKRPSNAISKHNIFNLTIVCKVFTNSNLVISVFNRQLKTYTAKITPNSFYSNVFWINALTKFYGVCTVIIYYFVFPISLIKDVDVVAFATLENVFALTADESVVTSTTPQFIVAGVALKKVATFIAVKYILTFIAMENVVAGVALEFIVALTTVEGVVAGVTIYQSIYIAHAERFTIRRATQNLFASKVNNMTILR